MNICHILLQTLNVDPDITDSEGKHSILLAAKEGHQDIIQLFIDFGADPHLPQVGSTFTAMDCARINGYQSLAKWLGKKRKLLKQEAEEVGLNEIYPNRNGIMIFINYIKFGKSGERKGAETDKKNIIITFKDQLGYTVDYHEDLSNDDTKLVLNSLKRDKRLWFNDRLVLLVSSHGKDAKNFVTSDEKLYNFDDIESLFTSISCPQMRNKPVVLLANYCSGTNRQLVDGPSKEMNKITMTDALDEIKYKREPVPPDTESSKLSYDASIQNLPRKPVPTHMAIIKSASEGIISVRHIDKGSLFIHELCTTLRSRPSDELRVIIDIIADNMKLKKMNIPTDRYYRPFRKFIFKLEDSETKTFYFF